MNQFNETSKSTTIRNFHLSLAVPTSPIAPSNEFDTTSKELTLNGIKTPEELSDYMQKNLKYGFYSQTLNKTFIRKELQNDTLYEHTLFNYYYLQKPEELLNTKVGICWDQVELEREWFTKHGYKFYTFFCNFHNHTFLVYEYNGKYYYFENSIKKFNGIHEANSLEDILTKYKEMQLSDCYFDKFKLYRYDNVNFGTRFYNFIYDATNGEINRLGINR